MEAPLLPQSRGLTAWLLWLWLGCCSFYDEVTELEGLTSSSEVSQRVVELWAHYIEQGAIKQVRWREPHTTPGLFNTWRW